MPSIPASQMTMSALKAAESADTRSTNLLKAAQQANLEMLKSPSDAARARRSILAQQAYNSRMNAQVSRVRAAFSLMADEEGTKAVTARQALQQVQNAQKRNVLAVAVQGGELRRNIMLQAAAATDKALAVAPGLPASIGGQIQDLHKTPSASQTTVGASTFRPKRYETVASEFFPADIRDAASSLRGIDGGTVGFIANFDQTLNNAIEQDAQKVLDAAKHEASLIAQQEPGAAQLAQRAEGLVASLQRRYELEMQNPTGDHPWLHMAGAALAGFFLYKVLR
jgi:hypothetical protein